MTVALKAATALAAATAMLLMLSPARSADPLTPPGAVQLFTWSNTVTGFNSYTGVCAPNMFYDGVPCQAPTLDKMAWVALEGFGVPMDAIGAFVSGILIITGGGDDVYKPIDLWTVEAALDDPWVSDCNDDRTSQATQVMGNDGIRTDAAHWVPLGLFADATGKRHVGFATCFHVVIDNEVTMPAPGTVPAVGVNFRLEAILRPTK